MSNDYHGVVTDRCVCGAEFRAEGLPSWVATRHETWLAEHKVCRINAATVASVKAGTA